MPYQGDTIDGYHCNQCDELELLEKLHEPFIELLEQNRCAFTRDINEIMKNNHNNNELRLSLIMYQKEVVSEIKNNVKSLEKKIQPILEEWNRLQSLHKRCKGCGILVGDGHVVESVNEDGLCDTCARNRVLTCAKNRFLIMA